MKAQLTCLPYLLLIFASAVVYYAMSTETVVYSGWPPDTRSEPAQIQARELAMRPGDKFKGKAALLIGMSNPGPAHWGHHFFPVLYYKHRVAYGNDLMNDAEVAGIPVVNEYGHWISPPMLALLAAAFYRPEDFIDRAAQAPRVYRANLARLLGVSLVVSDQPLKGESELFRGTAVDHPLYLSRVRDTNLGDYSPISTVLATRAQAILDQIQAPDFDGKRLAVIEQPLGAKLVPVQNVSVSMRRGPAIRVEAYSPGTSLLVLPFDFSHCLEVAGHGVTRVMPVNLAQTGLLVEGKVLADISYHYGLLKNTSCRKKDLERIRKLDLEEAATGRLFRDARPRKAGHNRSSGGTVP